MDVVENKDFGDMTAILNLRTYRCDMCKYYYQEEHLKIAANSLMCQKCYFKFRQENEFI